MTGLFNHTIIQIGLFLLQKSPYYPNRVIMYTY
nr:MAG TPA: hypothetical protein [Caudoviricetes sp.]